jgi:uncharacterized protein YbjQ (UPF0145 family)
MRTLRQIGSLLFVLGLFIAVFAGMPWYVVVADDPTLPWWLRTAVFSLLGGILIVLVTLAVEQRADTASDEGPLPAHTVFAVWLGKDLSAIVRLILGGELTEYTEMMGSARSVATTRMTAQAAEMGADAVINVRYMTTSVVGSAAELLVYGTAVKLG